MPCHEFATYLLHFLFTTFNFDELGECNSVITVNDDNKIKRKMKRNSCIIAQSEPYGDAAPGPLARQKASAEAMA
jgi:hypothetical protein